MLLATSAEEAALWRRASSLFNKAPPELLPPGLEVDTSNNADGESNWSNALCGSLIELISCPAFEHPTGYSPSGSAGQYIEDWAITITVVPLM
jgi:hypothetical protein